MTEKQDLMLGNPPPQARRNGVFTKKVVLAVSAAFCIFFLGMTFSEVEKYRSSRFFHSPKDRALFALKLSPLIDGHNDFPTFVRETYEYHLSNFSMYDHLSGHTDIPRIKEGMLKGQFWSLYVDCPALDPAAGLPWNRSGEYEAVHKTFQQIDIVKRMIKAYPEEFRFVTRSEQVLPVSRRKKVASMMGIEGLHQIAGSASTLRQYYNMGVRYATLAHNCDNVFADAAVHGNHTNGGLSDAGRKLVREMNRLGMMVDLSHVTPDVMHQTLDISVAPAFFSHSSAKGVYNHPRNVPDDVLKRIPEKDGIVMVNFYPRFISPDPLNATLETVVEHIMHIAKVTGSYKHIGVGADFDGIEIVPKGLEDVSKYPDLFIRLAEKGLSIPDLMGIAGHNLLRVWHKTEKATALVKDPPLEFEDEFDGSGIF
ncbi:dipeptidyl peptidase [Schizosaccharomyces japonicus yFS275]|uniref:Dipeptidase n=1 Tax=Schizosaccharomyces japonicus (strain yFS275 / FY16936) TaxID=402676 RepID=B6JY83_SCHJY|nr:dipeptidyl peptidase [Schizosaccharomyces japonicus yFS275]EEB06501.1 dipeptidyl peptidase [Schizosaccharomyces japonicus yFS275]